MLRIILFICFLSAQVTVSAQTNPFVIANIGGLNLAIATDTCFAGTLITNLSPNQKLVSSQTFSGNCGIWQLVDIPSPTKSVDTGGYICGGFSALCDILTQPAEPFIEVYNTDTTGLLVRLAPDTGHVTINSLNAKIWDGQRFAVTGNTQSVGANLWREIYLTDNCSQLTGWVRDVFLIVYTGIDNSHFKDPIPFTVHPNPATDALLIAFNNTTNNDYLVKIIDLQGKVLKSFGNINEINISWLNAGVYYIKLEQNSLSSTRKFLKL